MGYLDGCMTERTFSWVERTQEVTVAEPGFEQKCV